MRQRRSENVYQRHRKSCGLPSQVEDRRCGCSWTAADSYKDGSGRRKIVPRTFKTKRQAIAWLEAQRTARRDGTYQEPHRLTVRDYFMDDFLPNLPTRSVRGKPPPRATTIVSYELNLRRILPLIGHRPLQQLTAADLDTAYGQLLAGGWDGGRKPLSQRSVEYVHAVIRRGLNDALRQGLLSRNVALQAAPPHPKRPRARYWEPDQLSMFLAHVRRDRFYAAWVLASWAGIRRGELAGLRWSDVDLDKGEIRISRQLVQVGKLLEESAPKSDNGLRVVALAPEAVAVLRDHRRQQAAVAGYVFCWDDGSPLKPDWLTRRFRRLVKELDLPPIRLHDLRHSHASHLLKAGVHPKVVQQRLGHSSIQLTMDTYSHVMSGMDAEAAAKIGELVTLPERGDSTGIARVSAGELA